MQKSDTILKTGTVSSQQLNSRVEDRQATDVEMEIEDEIDDRHNLTAFFCGIAAVNTAQPPLVRDAEFQRHPARMKLQG